MSPRCDVHPAHHLTSDGRRLATSPPHVPAHILDQYPGLGPQEDRMSDMLETLDPRPDMEVPTVIPPVATVSDPQVEVEPVIENSIIISNPEDGDDEGTREEVVRLPLGTSMSRLYEFLADWYRRARAWVRLRGERT